jgi:polyferredoxin
MLMLGRFIPGGGWGEILLLGLYGALVAYHMQDPRKVHLWRKATWFAFSVVFFSQLILGITLDDRFLMTGKLHLPVPAMILAGPLYRGHLSVMSLLFVSTILLSGPAWCSHLCYFGAIDALVARGRVRRSPIRNKWFLKSTVLILVVAAALAMRWMETPAIAATIMGAGFGVTGLGLIFLVSRREGRMMHCTAYCPVGTVVHLVRRVNPFRMYIDRISCTDCMACTRSCRYDALNPTDIAARKPGMTCTLCGDCVSSCHSNAIVYKFPGLRAAASRQLYLLITITLHTATLGLARI